MKIIIINLAHATERQQKITAQFESFSLPFEILEATDGRLLTDAQRALERVWPTVWQAHDIFILYPRRSSCMIPLFKLSNTLPLFILAIYVAAVTWGVFSGGVWASLGMGGAVIALISVWCLDRRFPQPDRALTGLATITLAVMALLNLHSTQPALSWHIWLQLLSIFAPLLFFSSPQIKEHVRSDRLFRVTFVASLFGVLAFAIELYSNGFLLHLMHGAGVPLTEYNRGISYFVVLAFPLMAGLFYAPSNFDRRQKSILLGLFVMFLLAAASLTESRASKLALVLGMATVAAVYILPKLTRWTLAALPVLFIAWPFGAQYVFRKHSEWLPLIPDSWRSRTEIWDYMSYRITERPWLGWGLGSAKTLDFQQPNGHLYVFPFLYPAAHPHNVITQLWVELGVPGLVLGLLFAFFTLWRISKMDKKLMPFAAGAWMAALCLSLVAYNFWTDSMFSAFALTGLAFALLARHSHTLSITV